MAADALSSSSETVLVVDDDQGLSRLIQKALRREGFTAAAVNSGKEAILWLARNRAELMLLDLKLQDIEGKELVDHLAEIHRAVPFIVITGQGDERVAVDMMKRGALDYLVKDVNFLQFVPEVVRRGLTRMRERRRLAAAEQQLAASQAALRRSHEEVLAISEYEQRRFGQDLHDGLGQHLTAIQFMCHSLREDLAAEHPLLEAQAAKISEFLRETVVQTRALSHGLAPVKLEAGGLMEALRELVRTTGTIGKVKCRFRCATPVLIADSAVAGHLYRIAQETVNNALKHGHARKIEIELSKCDEALRLRISDDGKGFPKSKKTGTGIGLEVMKHRANVMGGTLAIESQPGEGVTVDCTVPLKEA